MPSHLYIHCQRNSAALALPPPTRRYQIHRLYTSAPPAQNYSLSCYRRATVVVPLPPDPQPAHLDNVGSVAQMPKHCRIHHRSQSFAAWASPPLLVLVIVGPLPPLLV
ncbi:Os11g0533900 [Oryza sativa Japonica Group]|uniref:Os11g0533900 protein n=1 Tax=Oryza sativa subsp. japonica TaxID=39947 RepID=A0A0P0Y2S9_ORYSJ|nr:Os11g0533900 [Oryza sativa Japonica Group]